MRALSIIALACAGCSQDAHFLVVTVETRPAVHDASQLKITLGNDSSMVTEDFEVRTTTFPATFSVSAEGRSGPLDIQIDALDENALLVGQGSTQTLIENATATVMVETTDFVVNTDFAEDQELSNYYAANGFQLGATMDGNWMAVYSSAPCTAACNMFGRRFDHTGRALTSAIAASSNGFPISNKLTTFYTTPSVAGAGAGTIAVWNADDPNIAGAMGYSIECRAIDSNGAAIAAQLLVSTDEFPNVASVTPLSNNNFAITWDGRVTTDLIRSAIVRPDCSLVGTVRQVSTVVGTVGPRGSSAAASADQILYAWILDGNVHTRLAQNNGTLVGVADTQILVKTVTEEIEHVRVAPLASGDFALLVRWALVAGTSGPGRIDLYRVSSAGMLMLPPLLVSDRSGSDFSSKEAFGAASRPDGSLLVVWHACNDKGDGNGCGVFGRLINASGAADGEEFVLATTITNDQTGPSAVALPNNAFATAWTDRSGVDPDRAGAAVRARIIYPALAGTSSR